MSRRTVSWLALAAVTVLLAGSGVALLASGANHPRPARRAASRARPLALGATSPSKSISFSLVLRVPGHAQLERDLSAVEDPHSPRYHHFTTPQMFGARYGVSNAALAATIRRLAGAGITVTESYPQRTALEVRAHVGDVSRLFNVQIHDFVDVQGRRWHAPLGPAVIPHDLGATVSGVAGLDTRQVIRPAAVPVGGLKPQDAALAYDLAPLHNQGILGQGQKIAIATFASFNDADPAAFMQHFGITGPAPQHVTFPEGAANTDPGAEGETNLDIDVIKSIAPQAQILVYEAPQTASFGQVFDRIDRDHRADIVTMSWGACELLAQVRAGRQRDQQAIDAARMDGITIFNSNGDRGAYNCQNVDPGDARLSVEWPTTSPGIVSVGGTRLYLDAQGNYIKETAWEDSLSISGGGGGLSTIDARPSFQSALGVQKDGVSTGKRQIPDVSADADSDTGWPLVSSGQLIEAGGTSAATPFWASSMLLIRQFAERNHALPLGYINPILYQLASTPQPFPPFHDITSGGNRYYQATPGWDFATGLGSPDVYNLARDIVGYLKAHPGQQHAAPLRP